MANPVLVIGGASRTDLVTVNSVTYSRALNRRGELQAILSVDNGYRPQPGDPVLLYQILGESEAGDLFGEPLFGEPLFGGETDPGIQYNLFGGIVEEVEESGEMGTEQLIYAVRCSDYWRFLDKRLYTGAVGGGETLYSAMTRIFTSVLEEEGFTITGVPNPGPTITETLRFNHEPVSTVLNKITQATGLFCLISATRNITLSAFASNPAPFGVTWEASILAAPPKIRRSLREPGYRNRQFARTQYALAEEITETFDGDAATFGFFVQQFMSAVPSVSVGGTPKVVGEFGIDGPPGAFNCYWARDGIAIYFYQTGTSTPDPPPIGVGNISATYHGPYRNTIVEEDVAAIAARAAIEGGSGKWEAITEERNIDTAVALTALAQGLLRANSAIATIADLPLNTVNEPLANFLEPGHRLTVDLTAGPHDLNDVYLVETVKSRWVRSTRPEGDIWEVDATITDLEPFMRAQEVIDRILEIARVGPDSATASTAGSPPASSVLEERTITAPTTINASAAPANDAAFLVLVLTMDGVGGHAITLGSGFGPIGVTIGVDTTAGATTRALFYGKSGLWYPVSPSVS